MQKTMQAKPKVKFMVIHKNIQSFKNIITPARNSKHFAIRN